ncbi:MAG: hypothetical protein OQK04_13990 [Kangiellaceae bacterium]|nr:hypothetical protein [Kangiellaceae bacterium]MCW8999815.1 hypothetical protein [Kangiellaceae bacterium]
MSILHGNYDEVLFVKTTDDDTNKKHNDKLQEQFVNVMIAVMFVLLLIIFALVPK